MSALGAPRRTFLALWPPPELQDALAAQLAGWLPSSFAPVRARELHLTLVFLGAVRTELEAAIDAEVARAVATAAPLELVLRGTGGFPGRGRERVLWAGVAGPGGAALAGLQLALAERMERLGLPREQRAWSPHVTLARARRERRPALLPERFYGLDFELPWKPPGVARVISRPGAAESERFHCATLQRFAKG